MAERRMFAKTVIDSDAFLEMPLSAQSLYFHLSMRADDEGFVGNPKKIQRMIGASDDDCKLLVMKSFIIVFDSGIIVIKHWKIHNYIRSDRFKETVYVGEKSMLSLNENNSYTKHGIPSGRQLVDKMDTQVSIGKDSIESGKDSIELGKSSIEEKDNTEVLSKKKKIFSPPTLEEVIDYCGYIGSNISPEAFIDHYETVGWKVGKNPMKDWQAAVRQWTRRAKEDSTPKSKSFLDDMQRFYDKYKAEEENENENQ